MSTESDTQIQYADLDDLYLDRKNPRLGRNEIKKDLTQDQVLEVMKGWSLEELAVSFLESGYWPWEAMIAVREPLAGEDRLVVVEGNRRLAALKLLHQARAGTLKSSRWTEIVKPYASNDAAFERLKKVPYILKESRASVSSFLGFRHVTGIKEWNPAEKAEFIAHLIEDEGLKYEQVRSRIGSKTPTVRQNYISFRLLIQMEDQTEDVDIERVEERFSVLYLSLRTRGVRQYLEINIEADEQAAKVPVPQDHLEQLVNFAKWVFGVRKQPPIVADSRQVDEFGHILESPAAIEYLERNESPSFAVASRMAGIAESVVSEHVERAADEIEEALKAAHQHRNSTRLQIATRRLGSDALQLLEVFPDIRDELLEQRR